ncbi:DUF1207 domain-containing protein [Thalassoglobus sp.]|uniref:DUF1207 domain-containing protein n=1 Tax=Thalassoglobus sp. TaxID=2795869 RepID=UPI003AA96BE4
MQKLFLNRRQVLLIPCFALMNFLGVLVPVRLGVAQEDHCFPPLALPPVSSFDSEFGSSSPPLFYEEYNNSNSLDGSLSHNYGDAQAQSKNSPFYPLYHHQDRSDWRWTFLPQGVLYGTYWASSAEPRMAVKVIEEQAHGSLIDSEIGGRIGFVRFGARNRLEGWQFDLLGGVNLRQDPDVGLDMQATDYRFDLPLTYRNGPHSFKMGYYHVSAHAGDEYLVTNQILTRQNYVRDVFNFGYSYNPTPELRLYGEVGYGFNVDVSEPLEFQFGFDYGPAKVTRIYGAPFVAANVHLKEELNFGGNVALQAGWAWRGEALAAGILRSGVYYYDGGSSQFAFYQTHETQVGWGLWYDY